MLYALTKAEPLQKGLRCHRLID